MDLSSLTDGGDVSSTLLPPGKSETVPSFRHPSLPFPLTLLELLPARAREAGSAWTLCQRIAGQIHTIIHTHSHLLCCGRIQRKAAQPTTRNPSHPITACQCGPPCRVTTTVASHTKVNIVVFLKSLVGFQCVCQRNTCAFHLHFPFSAPTCHDYENTCETAHVFVNETLFLHKVMQF